MINKYEAFNYKLKNFIHTLLLFLCMGVILSFLGFILAGVDGILWAVFLGVLILVISPNLSPSFIFSMYGGRLLSIADAPGLYQITQELAARANLARSPALYYLPSRLMNAFSVGTLANPAIGFSMQFSDEFAGCFATPTRSAEAPPFLSEHRLPFFP